MQGVLPHEQIGVIVDAAGKIAVARSRPSSSLDAPEWWINASLVSIGKISQHSPKLYGPLIDETALIRGSKAAARGA